MSSSSTTDPEALGSYLRVLLGAGDGGSRQDDGPDEDQQEQQGGSAPYEATVAVDDPYPLIDHVQPDGCPLTRRAVPLLVGPAALRLERHG